MNGHGQCMRQSGLLRTPVARNFSNLLGDEGIAGLPLQNLICL